MKERQPKRVPLWTGTFIGLMVVQFLFFLGFQILLPTLPTYAAELGANEGGIGLVTGLFTLSATLIRPLAGIFTDRFGRRGIFLIGMLVFTLSILSYAFIVSLSFLLVIRFVHGMGWAFTSTAAETASTDNIPRERFAEGLGFFSLASSVAMGAGPLLGIFLVNQFDYQTMFYIVAALCASSITLSFFIKYKKKATKIETTTRVRFDPKSLKPAALIFFVTISFGTIISFLAVHTAELGIENIGFFFTLFAVMMVIARPVWGLIIDRFGFIPVVVPAILLLVSAMVILSRAEDYGVFLVAALLYGTGLAGAHSSFQTMAIMTASADKRGAANALFLTGFDGGLAIGAILFGFLASSVGYATMYLIAAISPLIALLLFLFGTRTETEEINETIATTSLEE